MHRNIIFSIGLGMLFVSFVLFSIHAVLFMEAWDKLSLENSEYDDELKKHLIYQESPELVPVDLAFGGVFYLGIIVTIIGTVFLFKQRKKDRLHSMN